MATTINATAVAFPDGSVQTTGNVATGVVNLTGGTGTVIDMVITTPGVNWSVNSAVYNSFTSIAAQDLYMKSDGTRLYTVDSGTNKAYQYNLSTAFDIQTATYSGNATIGDTAVRGIFFKSDGTKMYILGNTNDRVLEYNLSTAWVVNTTTVSYVSNVSIFTQDGTPTGVAFSSDGTKMYISGDTTDKIYEYALSTAWQANSATYTSNVSISTVETSVDSVQFKSDGTRMYIVGSSSNKVHEYSLSSAWSINSASYSSNVSISSQTTGSQGLTFSANGHRFYVSDSSSTFAYNMSTGYRTKSIRVSNTSFATNATHIIIG